MLGDIFVSMRPQQPPPLPVAVLVLRSPLAPAATAPNGEPKLDAFVVRSPLPLAFTSEIPPPPPLPNTCGDLVCFSFVNFVGGFCPRLLPLCISFLELF